MTKIEQIRQSKAYLHNTGTVEELQKAAAHIWPYDILLPKGDFLYYGQKDGLGWVAREVIPANIHTYTVQEILAEMQPQQYFTRSGKAVEMLTTNGRGVFPYVGYVEGDNDVFTWYADGRYSINKKDSPYDLMLQDTIESKISQLKAKAKDLGLNVTVIVNS